jgi:hypothetical protein
MPTICRVTSEWLFLQCVKPGPAVDVVLAKRRPDKVTVGSYGAVEAQAVGSTGHSVCCR